MGAIIFICFFMLCGIVSITRDVSEKENRKKASPKVEPPKSKKQSYEDICKKLKYRLSNLSFICEYDNYESEFQICVYENTNFVNNRIYSISAKEFNSNRKFVRFIKAFRNKIILESLNMNIINNRKTYDTKITPILFKFKNARRIEL